MNKRRLTLGLIAATGTACLQLNPFVGGTPAMKNPATPRTITPQTGLSVFPGAEGFGTRTVAGRGGRVIVKYHNEMAGDAVPDHPKSDAS